MPNKGKFIGGQDNLFVPDAPTIGATSGAVDGEVSVAFTAPSDVGGDAITLYGASVFLAGATINYKVSVGTGTLSTGGSGNVYFIDGTPTKTLSLIKGFTYVFDLSDSSNSGHPFGFKNASDGAYTTGVTTSGTAGSASATVTLVLATDASEPSRYYCTSHGNGMGNTISLIEASASTDPLGAAQAGATGSSSPITVTGLTNGTSYIAQVWAINNYGNGPLSAATSSFTPVVASVGLFAGGQDDSAVVNTVQKIIVESAGNSTDFGDLSAVRQASAGGGSNTRFIVAGGYQASKVNIIEYFTYATAGNATDFGDIGATRDLLSSTCNNVRFITMGGANATNVIEYITIPSTGNATDYGDLTATLEEGHVGIISSTTRGILAGGKKGGSRANVIEYLTIASLSNGTDFGDMTSARNLLSGASSSTRGLQIAGDTGSGTGSNVIDYITIASTGNATDFGDTSGNRNSGAGLSSSTKAIVGGGVNNGSQTNIIESVTTASTGNATDFGDLLTVNKLPSAGCSGQASVQPLTVGTAIGLFTSGYSQTAGAIIKSIDKIIIETTGNATAFGDLTVARYGLGSVGSSTRLVSGGGNIDFSNPSNVMDYVTFASLGNATDFGDRTVSQFGVTGLSSSTRGLFAGGNYSSFNNVIDYITIASTGDATDFGDMTVAKYGVAGAGSTTRGILFGGGITNTSTYTDVIEYVTYTSTGNGTDFGDATVARRDSGAVSIATRLCALGGTLGSGTSNVIDYITISSTGNATDFGDLNGTGGDTRGNSPYRSNASSKVRGVVGGGIDAFGRSKDINYITIASTGNAQNFGDLSGQISQQGGASNAHGGLS